MRKVLVFQHAASEPLGTLNSLLKANGLNLRYCNFSREPDLQPKIENYSGLVILGGPMGVYEAEQIPHLKYEMKAIEQAFKLDIPVLGICLGSQLIAHVLGSEVKKAPHVELGWHPVHLTESGIKDPLFENYNSTENVFQFHQDHFDPPKSTEHLAFSPLIEGQAFRYGNKVYGMQFHLETDAAMIKRWMERPESLDFMKRSKGELTPEIIHADTQKYLDRSLDLSIQTFQRFIDLFQLKPRPTKLGSR